MSNIFKPAFFNTARVLDNSTISNGQLIVDVETHKTYVDYNNQRIQIFSDDISQLKEFQFTSLTSGVTVNQNGSMDIEFSKSQLGVTDECLVQLFDNSGYEIGSGSDIIIRWNDTTGNLEIQSQTTMTGTWLLRLYDKSQYSDFKFNSSTDGFAASQTSGFTATFSKHQLRCGFNEPMVQLYDNNGYEIGSSQDISIRWNNITGNLEIQSTTDISGTWTIKFSGIIGVSNNPGNNIIRLLSATIIPQHGIVYKRTLQQNDVFTISTTSLIASKQVTFELHLIQPATAVSFTLPNTLIWADMDYFDSENPPPDMSTANVEYCIIIRWDGTDLLANLAYTKTVTA